MEILRTENLSFAYPESNKNAVNNVSLSINKGEFVVLCGESGCGKTTLLKLLKKELAPFGKCSGNIYFNSVLQQDLPHSISECKIGYVLQNPDSQIVTHKVCNELAFGLENCGVDTNTIKRRTSEMASYFGIDGWFRKNTDELSGGQKQMLNLASVMVMQPEILILDEPTSQLDPISASEFINTLQKLNSELGLTILLSEHRLEDVFPVADRALIMQKGELLFNDVPENIPKLLKSFDNNHPMLMAMPSAVQIFYGLSNGTNCPLTVKQCKEFLENNYNKQPQTEIKTEKVKVKKISESNIAIELNNVWFRYEKNSQDVMRGVNLQVNMGEIFTILGGNGSGKTTVLSVMCGINKPYLGKVKVQNHSVCAYKNGSLYRNNLTMLPQNPQTVFVKDTVYDDFKDILKSLSYDKGTAQTKLNDIVKLLNIEHLLKMHPFDLSGGEQQKCAIAKILLTNPQILLLDEPTKGLDAFSKKSLYEILILLKMQGKTIVIVTHDVEFAANISDRCSLYFDGEIISCDTPKKFFTQNFFYTTAASRISRNMYSDAVTCDDVILKARQYGEKYE